MPRKRIFVVDDEEEILELVRYNLTREGYEVLCETRGDHVVSRVRAERPALIVLDLMLPGSDGLEICRHLKAEADTRSIPIVMLTAKGGEADIVTGLEMGADDYIAKPFSPRVLLSRIKAVLRRSGESHAEEKATVRLGDLVVDPVRYQVAAKGKKITLTLTEFRILHVLVQKPGWVFTRYQIVDAVRGDDYPVTDRSVDVQIVGLRRKLGPCGKYIETVRGVGYRMRES
jgi:two-component system alkaline phosphatase synthesis response regulator PhoP